MRTRLRAWGLLAILGCGGCAPPNAEKALYDRLAEGPDAMQALQTVLATPEQHSALILYFGAGVAFNANRLEDSGFLFYAAQLRARFDQECFPAKGTGEDSPFVAYAALSRQLGSGINPAIMAEPKAFGQALERVKAWSPKASPDYNPGYEFTQRKTQQEAQDAAEPNRAEFLGRMSDLAALLNDAEYCAAFRIMQASHLATDDQRPTERACDEANRTMKRIEKDKGLPGFPGMWDSQAGR